MAQGEKTKNSPASQQTISSFFSKSPKKRASSPIDLTVLDDSDNDLTPLHKKAKIGASPFFHGSGSLGSSPAGPSSSSEIATMPKVARTTLPTTRKAGGRRIAPFPLDGMVCGSTGTTASRVRQGKGKRKAVVPRMPSQDASYAGHLPGRGSSSKKRAHHLEYVGEEMLSEDFLPRDEGWKGKGVIGPAGLPCTPLEEEVIKFKKSYPATVLLIEVGYKYCFFGDDAKIAGKVLGFGYGQTNNFLRTSFPIHNLKINAKKLVAAGHRVGVISQIETAALKKAGDNRNALFDRKLTQLLTPATFVDDLDSTDDIEDPGQATPPLMCIVEANKSSTTEDKVILGFLSVVPSTGELVYDEFEDNLLRSELETRLTHIRPCELLLQSQLTTRTEKVLRHFSEYGMAGRVRLERMKKTLNYTEAFDYISKFYDADADQRLAVITDLPKYVVIALAYTHEHLSAFELSEVLLEVEFFKKFTTRTHMLLNRSTLNNLEIYRNQTDGTEKGTLFSVINRTRTMFGKRLLKSWLGRPLVDMIALRERIDAVDEARLGESTNLTLLRDLLKGLPDLARGLCGIQYGRCNPKELAALLTAFNRIGATFPKFSNRSEVGCTSPLWTDIIYALPNIHDPIKLILLSINLHRAREDDKENLWTDPEKYPAVAESRLAVMATESDLAQELKRIRKLLRMPSLNYTSTGNLEFLIEIPKERVAPEDWSRVGSTTKVARYHTPTIIRLLAEREQYKETFQGEVQRAYKSFLRDIAKQYALFRDIVNKLAAADCLMSMATLSLNENLCKPTFVDTSSLSIVTGRHPVIEHLRSDPFVPNSIALGGDYPRNLVITGPNMGGKSSVVRMTAILVILAQIGSHVPAESMHLSIHDSILTRMGAADDLAAGRSTFMVEIAETCEIIRTATEKSLVILDELGRGTSTFDGMAIAGAVLEHLAREVKCKTLFITHYPTLARELEVRYPGDVGNVHMSFREDTSPDGRLEIRFLYKLVGGISGGSFGIECARLAGIPDAILHEATHASERMQIILARKAKNANAKNVLQLIQRCVGGNLAAASPFQEFMTQIRIMGLYVITITSQYV